MAKTAYFLATNEDSKLICDWFAQYSPDIALEKKEQDYAGSIKRKCVYHFDKMGPIVTWENEVDWSSYKNARQQKKAFLARRFKKENPKVPLIKHDESPLVIYDHPVKRESDVWVCASVTFTPKNMNKTFPELNKISLSFNKYIRSFGLVYSWDGREELHKYPNQTKGFDGYCIKVYALPEARSLLTNGALFVEQLVSPGKYSEYLSEKRT